MAVFWAVELDIEVDAPFFLVIQTLEIPLGSATWGHEKNRLDVVDEQLIIQQGQGSSEKEFLDFAEAWTGIHNSNFAEKLGNC